MKRTTHDRLLGIARASQKMGDVTTARVALERLKAEPPLENRSDEIQRVTDLVRADFEKERLMGEGALLNLDHPMVKMEIRRGGFPQAILETARRQRSLSHPEA